MSVDPHTATTNGARYASDEDRVSAPDEGKAPRKGSVAAAAKPDGDVESVDGYTAPGIVSAEAPAPSIDYPSAGEASYGPAPIGIETVHLPDDRVQINNTGDYPWRAQCALLMTAQDNSKWIGSGTFIGPRTVLTAGHCVHVKNSGVAGQDGWMRSIVVMPGRNGNTMPYGSQTSSVLRSVSGWTTSGSEEYDYGVILLGSSFNNGWFGITALNDGDLTATVGNIAGYPGDKPSGSMWFASRKIASVGPRKIYYDIDTAGGQSGSSVYRFKDNARHCIGIHAYGGGTVNSGTRITNEVFNNLVSWTV